MTGRPVVVGFNATQEAADGLALAEVLARLTGAEIVIARVLRDMIERAGHSLPEQREVRRRVAETREAVVAALPEEAADADIIPLLDTSLARGLHAFAKAQGAAFLVVGSSHRQGLGRRLLGGSAQQVIDGAHCPVAVASPGFRELDPRVISVAYDGKAHSRDALDLAASLAAAGDLPLRVVTAGRDVPDVSVPGEQVLLTGDPANALVAETARTGLLVMGSHGRDALRRALLGSVSAHVVQSARCPIVICPGG
jgi:nucleotide-binding universal stress UspA family protein